MSLICSSDEGVNLGNLRAQLVAVTLDETARDDKPFCFSVSLHARRFEDRINGLSLRRINEAAGVYHQRFGLSLIGRDLITGGGELTHHHFAINQILRTTQTDKANFLHNN